MEIIDQDLILQEIPLFASLSAKERRMIKERSVLSEYKKGQLIYQEGSPGDAFYCVVLGRVVIYVQDASGNETILEYLHHGKYFGIISLLTQEPHSVTAKAMNDCSLLVIKKDDFSFLLKKIPALAIDLSQTLSRRLKNKDIHQKRVFESSIISVFSSYTQAGKTIYALNLALSLKKKPVSRWRFWILPPAIPSTACLRNWRQAQATGFLIYLFPVLIWVVPAKILSVIINSAWI